MKFTSWWCVYCEEHKQFFIGGDDPIRFFAHNHSYWLGQCQCCGRFTLIGGEDGEEGTHAEDK